MPKKISDFKKKNKQRGLFIIAISLVTLFFLAAMMRIGVGEAEWAGMTVSDLTPGVMGEFNIPSGEMGVVVDWVEGPAFYAGLKEGDLVKAINNVEVRNIGEFLKVANTVDLNAGILLDVMRYGQPLYITVYNKLGLHGKIKQAFSRPGAAQVAAPGPAAMTNVAFQAPVIGANLPTPKEQGAAGKRLVEGHWLGMELIPLTPQLAKTYRIPLGTKGLLVDEISLEAAESGILAGDMVVAVNGFATPDLTAFTEATRRVKNRKSAKVHISRKGELLELIFSAARALGFSQNEAAQPILPGALRPHKDFGKPCTACHIIMRTGGQLPTDAGDLLPTPPTIRTGAKPLHGYRGPCNNCHVILK